MPTSAEIAQQIADQQSWFMQQNALASQIGMSPMGYGNGGGVMPSHPGMAAPSRGFSFAPQSNAYSTGNRAGAVMGGVMGATPMLASVLAGSNPLTNPISGFMAARGLGMGMAGAGVAAGAMMLPMAAAGAAVGQVVQGAQQQSMLNTAVMGGGYNFANASSLTGQGFSRQDSMNIGRQVRQLQMIPELMTSFDEITKILPQLKSMGVMQGVRDAAEFGKRMKEAIGSIREVSKILGTSMADATEFFAHSRRVGFFGSGAAAQNALNAQVTMSATGMDRSTHMQMQEQAASAATAMGGSRLLGVAGADKVATRLGLQVTSNPELQATIQNITGLSGPEGLAAMSNRIMNTGQRMAGTAIGRFQMAGAMKVGANGRVGIDADLMESFRNGEISMDEIRQRGSRNMGSGSFVKKFVGNQTKLGQQFAAEGGPEVMGAMLAAQGFDEDSARIILQQQGISEEETDLYIQNMNQERSGAGQERRTMQGIINRNTKRRMNSAGGISSRLGKRFSNMFEPLRQAGAELTGDMGSYVDEIKRDLWGDHEVRADDTAKKDFRSLVSGSGGSAAAARSFGGKGISATSTSFTSSVADAFKDTDMYAFINRGENDTGRTANATFNQLRADLGSGGVTTADLKRRIDKRLAGEGAPAGGYSEVEQAGIEALRERIKSEYANNAEFATADEAKKLEMVKDMTTDLYSGSEVSAARMSIGGGNAFSGFRVSGDASTHMALAAYAGLKDTPFALNVDKLMSGAEKVLDPTAVAQARDDAKKAMGKAFGEGAAYLMKDEGAQELAGKFYAMSPEERQKVSAALASGKTDGLSADVKKLVEALPESERMTMYRTLAKGQADGGGAALASFKSARSDEAKVAFKSSLDDMAKDAKETARDNGLSATAKEAISKFATASSNMGSAMMGEGDVEKASSALGKSIEDVMKALEDPKASPAEKKAAAAALEKNPALRMAAQRKKSVESNLRGLVGKETTIKELAEKTRMSQEDVRTHFGNVGEDGKVTLDQGAAGRLISASTKDAGASAAGATAEATKRQAKEDQQIVLFKTMTEALVAIAGDKLDKTEAGKRIRAEYVKNREALAGTAAPGT